jgi:Holliday junction resolvasome RuvABC endonuclease subunit
MRVLAFDASSTVGWASFASARSLPACGSFELSSSLDYGARSLDMQAHVLRLIDEHAPELVAFEQPIFYPRDRWHTRRLLTSLVVVIELVAACKGLRVVEIEPTIAKLALTGSVRATKAEMVAAAGTMGWTVGNHHEADACAVALATYAQLARCRVS